MRKFDRKRPKKMSNQEWENPDDPDAKIGPKKDGATDMIYKPETVVDLDSGAIVGAEILPGDQADHQEDGTHILEAQHTINAAWARNRTLNRGDGHRRQRLFRGERVAGPAARTNQDRHLRSDPPPALGQTGTSERQAVQAARRSAQSKYGQKFLRRRGMHLERAFAHILDVGGCGGRPCVDGRT